LLLKRLNSSWFYSELPAQSCQEIKESEGKDTISNKYWLDPNGTGTEIWVYCDMNLD
ncbi:hypothetical protein OS493_039317, partial [Desmophyllum pertusum]